MESTTLDYMYLYGYFCITSRNLSGTFLDYQNKFLRMIKYTSIPPDNTRFLNISVWYESVCKLRNLKSKLFSVSQYFTLKSLLS